MFYTIAKAFKLESDFETSIFCCDFVKILVNPLGFTAFLPLPSKNTHVTKFSDLKRAAFRVDFGDAQHKRKSLMCDKEPKDALKPPFKAGSSLNALAEVVTFC